MLENQIAISHRQHIRHGLSTHRLYAIWNAMINRTSNINHNDYNNYGGRGIIVCERWKNIHNFIDDMYITYNEGLSIDRVNHNGNYELSNCRWVTMTTQARNKRKPSSNTSGYRGVSWNKSNNKWMSIISINNKLKYIGSFKTAIEAAKAYDRYVIDNNLDHTINGV